MKSLQIIQEPLLQTKDIIICIYENIQMLYGEIILISWHQVKHTYAVYGIHLLRKII